MVATAPQGWSLLPVNTERKSHPLHWIHWVGSKSHPLHCTHYTRIRSGTPMATRFSLQSNVYLKPFPPPSFFFDCIYIAALRLHQHSPIFFLRPNTFHLLLNLVASSFLFTLLSPHLSFHLSFIHLSIPFSLYFPLFYVPS